MASAPQSSLPVLYKDLVPLNSQQHLNWKGRQTDKAPWIAKQHAIPLTVEEFIQAQRYYPITFSSGSNPVPLGLLGLNEGINVYFKEDGSLVGESPYVPAYVRRYPFLLAKLDDKAENLSLCFDPTTDLVGDFEDGRALFEADGQPSDHTKDLLGFCEKFEQAGARTQAFMKELTDNDLLMEGEVSINRQDNPNQPYVYRGFQMVNQEKLREMRGDKLRTWNQNGLLPLIYAHLFSLDLMRMIFAMQVDQGKGPVGVQPNGAEPIPAA